MSIFVNIDVLTGIKTKWAATSALIAVIPVASLYTGSVKGGLAFPYCVVTCTREKEPEFPAKDASGGSYVDYRRVKFEVWDYLLTDLATTGDLIAAAFNTEFAIPNSTVIDFGLAGDPDIVEDELRAGKTVHKATLEYLLIHQRTTP